jgi:hypothetical protein
MNLSSLSMAKNLVVLGVAVKWRNQAMSLRMPVRGF